MPCFCAGISKNCKKTGRYRNQISLRFKEEDNFKGNETVHAYEADTPSAEIFGPDTLTVNLCINQPG